MNDSPDEDDLQLTHFLRQHRSIAPPESVDVEDRLMSAIEVEITREKYKSTFRSWRRIFVAFGLVAVGSFVAVIYNPNERMETNVAEIDKLDRYLLTHSHNFVPEQEAIDNHDNLDAFLLQEEDDDVES
jgi:hypothetical protein